MRARSYCTTSIAALASACAICNLLLAIAYCEQPLTAIDEVWSASSFDALTLEVRNRFGRGRYYGMTVVGSEMFFGNQVQYTIDVFYLAGGAYLRSIRGDFRAPKKLLHHDGSMYIGEEAPDEVSDHFPVLVDDCRLSEEPKKATAHVMNRRILVTRHHARGQDAAGVDGAHSGC